MALDEDFIELLKLKCKQDGYLIIDDLAGEKLTDDQKLEAIEWAISQNIEVIPGYVAYLRHLINKDDAIDFCYYIFLCRFLGENVEVNNFRKDKIKKEKIVIDTYLNVECNESELRFVRTKYGLDNGELCLSLQKLYDKLGYQSLAMFDNDSKTIHKIMNPDYRYHRCLTNMLFEIERSLDFYQYKVIGNDDAYDELTTSFKPYIADGRACGGAMIYQWKNDDDQIAWITTELKTWNWMNINADGSWEFGHSGKNKMSANIQYADNKLIFSTSYSDIGDHGNKYIIDFGKSTTIEKYEKGKLLSFNVIDFSINADLKNIFSLGHKMVEGTAEKIVDEEGNISFVGKENKASPCYKVLNNANAIIGFSTKAGFCGTTITHTAWNDCYIYRNMIDGVVVDKSPKIIVDTDRFPSRIIFSFYNNEGHKCSFVYNSGIITNELLFNEFEGDNKEPSHSANLSDPFFKKSLVKETKIDKNDGPEAALNKMIGLDSVKKQVERLKAILKKSKDKRINLNMVFSGNPGTGKTVVARLLGSILYKEGLLPTDTFIEVDRSMLVAKYEGQTENNVKELIEKAKGGVIFVDEAYSLISSEDDLGDFGRRALDAFVKAMEDYRGEICFIFAGYKGPMLKMMDMNPGFKSRINRFIEFPNYSVEELREICLKMASDNNYKLNDGVVDEIIDILKEKLNDYDFANAREVRNILESLYEIQAVRTYDSPSDFVVTIDDVKEYEKDINFCRVEKKEFVPVHIDKNEIEKVSKVSNELVLDSKYLQEASVNIKSYSDGKLLGEGSGFFITPSGLIGTCEHVINGADKVEVNVNIFTSKNERITKTYDTSIVGFDEKADVALIKINKPDMEYSYYSLADREYQPALLSKVVMAGYPLGKTRFDSISINEGKIQSYNEDAALKDDVHRIYIDLTGHPGNSGSGVVDVESKKCIGIFAGASIEARTFPVVEINYAIPVSYLWELIDKLSNN